MKKNASVSRIAFVVVLLILFISISTVEGQQRFIHKSGGQFAILRICDSSGVTFATLFMMGEEMEIDSNGYVIKGAGKYLAEKGNYFPLFFTTSAIPGGDEVVCLHVKAIEWDEKGNTTSIDIADPVLESQKTKISITSDLSKPILKNGVLYLELNDIKEELFGFQISFGKGLSVVAAEPSSDK